MGHSPSVIGFRFGGAAAATAAPAGSLHGSGGRPHGSDIVGGVGLPADRPRPARGLRDCGVRDRAQGFAFDRDHRLGHALDQLAFLLRGNTP